MQSAAYGAAAASREDALGVPPISGCQFRPIPADNFDSELVRDGSDDGDILTGMIPLLTERDAAVRLRVTLNDLNALLKNGELPYSLAFNNLSQVKRLISFIFLP